MLEVDYVLRFSFIEQKIIEIIYMKRKDIIQRKIRVLKINKDNVKAWDLEKQAIRIFKRENILAAMDIGLIMGDRDVESTNFKNERKVKSKRVNY